MTHSDRIAAKLADWHGLDIPGERVCFIDDKYSPKQVPSVWARIEKWLSAGKANTLSNRLTLVSSSSLQRCNKAKATR